MTLELDMYFLKYEPTLSIGQLVFLGLVKKRYQNESSRRFNNLQLN